MFTYLLMHSVAHPLFRNDSAKCNILGCGDLGMVPMIPKFELGRHFCTTQVATKLNHLLFNHLEVIVLTKAQLNVTLLKTSTSFCCATPVGKYKDLKPGLFASYDLWTRNGMGITL